MFGSFYHWRDNELLQEQSLLNFHRYVGNLLAELLTRGVALQPLVTLARNEHYRNDEEMARRGGNEYRSEYVAALEALAHAVEVYMTDLREGAARARRLGLLTEDTFGGFTAEHAETDLESIGGSLVSEELLEQICDIPA